MHGQDLQKGMHNWLSLSLFTDAVWTDVHKWWADKDLEAADRDLLQDTDKGEQKQEIRKHAGR
jgi:hypothetical protein